MKKYLLLLISAFAIAQTAPSRLPGLIITANQPTVTSTPNLTTTEANGLQGKISPVNLPLSNATATALETYTENSSGALSGFLLTDNGNGTVNISSGVALLRSIDQETGLLSKYTIPAVTNLALTDNANNFVLANYNGGSPSLTVTTDPATINTTTNTLVWLIARVGNKIDRVYVGGQNVDSNGKLRRRFLNSEPIFRAQGAALSYTNRTISVSGGLFYLGLTPYSTSTLGATFTNVYDNASVWTRQTAQTQVNNTQYNVNGVLTIMNNGRFRVDYVYLLVNSPSQVYTVMGSTQYNNLAEARLAALPNALPVELQRLGVLVGRLIIEKDATAITEVSSAYDVRFNASTVINHNDTGAIQGGAVGDYQHVTTSEKATWNGKANLASPSFTGTPTAPTATAGTNTTQVATTAFVGNSKSKIYCWGDSMTFGTGSTALNDFPSLLIPSTNWESINKGVPGETSTQIKNRFVSYYTLNPEELKKPVIIWAGRNNYPNATTIKADIATMIAMLPHKNYLVLGITNSNPGEPIGNSGYTQIVTLNNELKTLYGGRFLDVRAWLVANYNPLLPQDVIDFGLDLPPTSLLSDNIHLNDKGYRLVLDLIVKNSSYLKNEESIFYENLNAKKLFLPDTPNSILKTNVNGQVTNSVIYENSFNLGLGFLPNAISDTQNFEFINGATIASRVALPQFALSTNAYGTFYAAKYKTSNFSAQILLNGNAGDIIFYTAPSGIANADVSYQNRLWITNSGRIVVGFPSDNGVDRIQVNGSVGIETFMYIKPSTTPASPREGTVYYDSTSKKLRCWNGTTWNDLF